MANKELTKHSNNPTVKLFKMIKDAKTVKEVLDVKELYPLNSLLSDIATAQEFCKKSNDWKTWLLMQKTILEYTHKSAQTKDEPLCFGIDCDI